MDKLVVEFNRFRNVVYGRIRNFPEVLKEIQDGTLASGEYASGAGDATHIFDIRATVSMEHAETDFETLWVGQFEWEERAFCYQFPNEEKARCAIAAWEDLIKKVNDEYCS